MSRIAAIGWCFVVAVAAVAWHAAPAAAQLTSANESVPNPPKVADGDLLAGGAERARHDADAGDAKAEVKIREALRSPTRMEFIDTPLIDAIDYLKDLHGIEIQLDTKGLEEAGIGTETPVTRKIKGISLAAALRLILDDMGMTQVVRNGVLLISTPQAVSRMIELRVYDVRDLIDAGGDTDDLPWLLQSMLMPSAVSRAQLALAAAGGAAIASDTAPARAAHGPQIETFGNLLVVRTSAAEQDTLADLLSELRAKIKQAD